MAAGRAIKPVGSTSEVISMDGAVQMLLVFLTVIAFLLIAMRRLLKWRTLEISYSCQLDVLPRQISRGSYRWVSGRVGYALMVLSVELYPDVLWIRPGNFYRWAFRPVCIPWQSIEIISHGRWLFHDQITLHVSGYPYRLKIHGAAASDIVRSRNG